MKILSLFCILAISSLCLSAQDTIPAKHLTPPEHSKETTYGGEHIHDTVYVIRPQNFISESRVLHIRNAGIVLSSVGGGFMLGGVGLILGGTRPGISENSAIGTVVGGGMLIGAGFWVSVAGAGKWIAYAVRHHQYKKQEEYHQSYR